MSTNLTIRLDQPLAKPPSAEITRYSVRGARTLQRFLLSREPIEGLMGPFGSGKSVACIMKSVLLAHEMARDASGLRRSRFVVVRNTYPQLRDTTMRTLYEWLPPAKWGETNGENHSYKVLGFEGVEIEYLFRALDRPDHVQNLLSLEASHAWGNEARELPKEVIGPLRGRLGRFPKIRDVGQFDYHLMFDTNPPDASADSWWYDLFEVRKPPGAVVFKQPSGLSPQAENLTNLPRGYYQAMVESMSPDEVVVYVEGSYGYIRTGKPVYPEYRDTFHCREFEPLQGKVLRCWDFGLTPACILVEVTPRGQVRVFDEVVSDRAGIQAFAPVVHKHITQQWPWLKNQVRDIADPAGKQGAQTDERTCFELLAAVGIDCMPGEQDPTMRLEAVRHLLRTVVDGEPGLLIHPRCERLRKGFQGEYHYRRIAVGGGVEKYADTPNKNKFSHPHDALQYGAVELVGDRVLGYGDSLQNDGARQTHAEADFNPLDVNYLQGGSGAQQRYLDEYFRTGR